MVSIPILALAAIVLYFILIRPLYNAYHESTNAKRLNCKAPHTRVNKWPFGIDHLRRLIAAHNRDMVCEEFKKVCYEQPRATFQHWVFGKRMIFTAEPKNLQAVLATKFADFDLPHTRQGAFWPLLGLGIFTSNGQTWAHSRALLRPQFTRQQVADLEQEEICVQQLLLHIKPDQSGWTDAINLGPLFFNLTIDSATQFLFGQSVESQLQFLPGGAPKRDGDYDWRNLSEYFDTATQYTGQRVRRNRMYWTHNPAEFRKACKEVHAFADHFVQQALKRTEAEKPEVEGEKKRYVFLDELIKDTRDPAELRSQLLHLLLAGRDTTAGLIGWTFFLLARHPDVYKRLRETILETFGTYNSPHDITFERLKSCSYLQHVLQETLRLFPSIPLNSRMANKDTTLPTGGGPDGTSPIFLAKGQEVGYSVFVMHRRKDLWGPDAEQFNPDRWLTRRHGFDYLPFNAGPRICPGQQYALTEAAFVTTRLVQLWDEVKAVDPTEEHKHQLSITSAPKAVNVYVHVAQDS